MAKLPVLDERTAPSDGRPPPRYVTTAAPVVWGDGFYVEEKDAEGPFRWMQLRGRVEMEQFPEERFLELEVLSEFYDLSQELSVDDQRCPFRSPLVHGWNFLSLRVPPEAAHLTLEASKLYPPSYYPADPRQLAVRVRKPLLHADPGRHGHVARQHRNAVLNRREMLDGRAELRSTAPNLGIDLYGECNVKPPCVYCEWEYNKASEGDNVHRPFTKETLAEWGELFDNAAMLVNCSIGEPFMMKSFDELLDIFGERGKFVEMATNGQILTDRNIERLLGRNFNLYISLDAATPETYAKLRNDKFLRIVANLRRLMAARGGRGGLPRVFLVFMPMRVNVHELEGFVRLCADLEVDRMVLRPLQFSETIDLEWVRDGYRFDYKSELLPFDELVRVSGRSAALCRHYGVELSDQMDFGGSMERWFAEAYEEGRAQAAASLTIEDTQETEDASAEQGPDRSAEPATQRPSLGKGGEPLCEEPWKCFYILRRGTLPCCYGGEPIADMDGYREAWNSPLLQSIRAELAAGRFHQYCLDSPGCPLVRKSRQHGDLPARQDLLLRLRRWWHRFDAACFGIPRRIYRPIKTATLALAARLRRTGDR